MHFEIFSISYIINSYLRISHEGYIPKTPPTSLRTLLQRPHSRIPPIRRQQLSVRAALDDAPGIHHQNLMRVHHGGQAVGDDQGGLVLRHALQLALDGALVGAVKGTGGLVENQDGRVFEQGAGNGYALFFVGISWASRISRVTASSSYGTTASFRKSGSGTSARAICAATRSRASAAAVPANWSPERRGLARARSVRRSAKAKPREPTVWR